MPVSARCEPRADERACFALRSSLRRKRIGNKSSGVVYYTPQPASYEFLLNASLVLRSRFPNSRENGILGRGERKREIVNLAGGYARRPKNLESSREDREEGRGSRANTVARMRSDTFHVAAAIGIGIFLIPSFLRRGALFGRYPDSGRGCSAR